MNYESSDNKDLCTSEKIMLVEKIWGSIAEDNINLSKETKDLLDERLASFENSSKRTTWDKIKKMSVQKSQKKCALDILPEVYQDVQEAYDWYKKRFIWLREDFCFRWIERLTPSIENLF